MFPCDARSIRRGADRFTAADRRQQKLLMLQKKEEMHEALEKRAQVNYIIKYFNNYHILFLIFWIQNYSDSKEKPSELIFNVAHFDRRWRATALARLSSCKRWSARWSAS
eukprot:SAG11_NODE_867_length_6831_cov_5.720737_2_plen_110_part_00